MTLFFAQGRGFLELKSGSRLGPRLVAKERSIRPCRAIVAVSAERRILVKRPATGGRFRLEHQYQLVLGTEEE